MAVRQTSPTPGSNAAFAWWLPRLLLLAGAALALATGVYAGLVRIGTGLPPAIDPTAHGPLMVAGFLATLVGLERAVAVQGQPWAYAAPGFGVAGTISLLAGLPAEVSITAFLASAFVLLVATARLFWLHPALFTATMCAGAVALYAGHLSWLLGSQNHLVASLWMGFLVATVAGERLELSRVRPKPKWAESSFGFLLCLFAFALLEGGLSTTSGARTMGASLLGLSVWLVYFDLARQTIRHPGQPRFVSWALLSGFAWLGCAGVLAIASGATAAGPRYDAILHSVFVGFVFAMVFAHAPVILPSVLFLRVPFSPYFYVGLVLLEVSVAARVAGDLWWLPWLRQWGAWGHVVAIVVFVATLVRGIRTMSGQHALSGASFSRRN